MNTWSIVAGVVIAAPVLWRFSQAWRVWMPCLAGIAAMAGGAVGLVVVGVGARMTMKR